MRLFHSLSRKTCVLGCLSSSADGPVISDCCPPHRVASPFKSPVIFFLVNFSFLTFGYLLLLFDILLSQNTGGQNSTTLIEGLMVHSCSILTSFLPASWVPCQLLECAGSCCALEEASTCLWHCRGNTHTQDHGEWLKELQGTLGMPRVNESDTLQPYKPERGRIF